MPETVIFIQAGARGAAVRKAAQVLATLRQVPTTEVSIRNVASHAELVAQGGSDDEDLRMFETSWREDDAGDGWIRDPLFLSNDESLLATWAELMAEIAYQEAERAMKKAR